MAKYFFSHFFNPKFADKTGPSTTDSPNRSLFDKTCESPKITNFQEVLESVTNSGSEDEIESDHEPDQDENIFNWDGVNMELNASFKDTQAVRCCRFSPDGQRYDFKDKNVISHPVGSDFQVFFSLRNFLHQNFQKFIYQERHIKMSI